MIPTCRMRERGRERDLRGDIISRPRCSHVLRGKTLARIVEVVVDEVGKRHTHDLGKDSSNCVNRRFSALRIGIDRVQERDRSRSNPDDIVRAAVVRKYAWQCGIVIG